MSRYFLSYARGDAQFALRLADDLRDAGIDLWVDQRDILPSQRWDRAVEAALRDCAAVVIVLSPRSVASENVLDEVSFAMDHAKDVIPVLVEACDVPMRISRLQRVDFTGDYQAALERCRSVLDHAKGALDPEVLRRAAEQLAVYLGPLAGKLVEVDALQARDAAELYRLLASHIIEPAKRSAFLKSAPGARLPTFEQPLLDAVTLEVTKILGPISSHLVKQASRQAADSAELYQRLAGHVADTKEREQLLKRLRAL